jgi:hypothetical protein
MTPFSMQKSRIHIDYNTLLATRKWAKVVFCLFLQATTAHKKSGRTAAHNIFIISHKKLYVKTFLGDFYIFCLINKF